MSKWYLTSEYDMRYISKILDKHDLMIRKEIDEEIEVVDILEGLEGLLRNERRRTDDA